MAPQLNINLPLAFFCGNEVAKSIDGPPVTSSSTMKKCKRVSFLPQSTERGYLLLIYWGIPKVWWVICSKLRRGQVLQPLCLAGSSGRPGNLSVETCSQFYVGLNWNLAFFFYYLSCRFPITVHEATLEPWHTQKKTPTHQQPSRTTLARKATCVSLW